MARKFKDWLTAYCDYANYTEAPRRMHFWSGVSSIAGALRRKVWIDQFYFKWFPNFYIIIVAPPGIVSKSTTADISLRLLRKVPGIQFGPHSVTWQALVQSFQECREEFKFNETYYPMCALTIESSELGNLLNPQDRDMVDLLVTLWDGKEGAFEKVTKMNGKEVIANPWINLIGCTTPAWIAGNVPDYMIGGGFTSRCLFVYADTKEKLVAYPILDIPIDLAKVEAALVYDLEHIATNFVGPFTLDASAVNWGTAWYKHHYDNRPSNLDDERFGGYIARKQTHIHKLAIILAASSKDTQVISELELATANTMVSELEADMPLVFAKIGRTDESIQAERFINFVQKRGKVSYAEAYRFIHAYFPDVKDFEGIVSGAIRSEQIILSQHGSDFFLEVNPKLKLR